MRLCTLVVTTQPAIVDTSTIVVNTNASAIADRQNMTVKSRLLIVDDHEEFRDSARILLEGEGFEVIGAASTGEDAVGQTIRLAPDLVLLDIHLPGMDGFATADQLAALANPPAVVLISSRERGSFGARIGHAPVRGFLAKHELSGESLTSLLA